MPYAKNLWYVAAWSHDLRVAQPLGVQILGEPIVLWRNDQRRVAALEDRCVHRLAPLSLGRCEGDKLRCMYHGLLYNASGAVTEIPGQDVIPPQAKVRSYPVVDQHSWIWVWMGEASAADQTLIPPAVGLDDPDFILGFGQLDYAAEARLINDNLLDFSHLSYVHASTFGASEQWAKERPKVIPLAQGVAVERWVTVQPGTPGREYAHAVEHYSHYDFLLPGVLLMTGGAFPLGTKDQLAGTAPNLDLAIGGVTFTSQAVTPLTAKTSRYFFSWGPHRRHGDAEQRDKLMAIAGRAFAEDRAIIEAQQRVIDVTTEPRIMPTGADRAIILFNQMVSKRLREEEGATVAKAHAV